MDFLLSPDERYDRWAFQIFQSLKSAYRRLILPMDLFLRLGEDERDGIFNFRESEKHLKKTLGGSFFVSLVPLGQKRDNLPREYSSNQIMISVLLLRN